MDCKNCNQYIKLEIHEVPCPDNCLMFLIGGQCPMLGGK